MTRVVQLIAIWCVMATAVVAWAQTPEGRDRYLDRPRGPYRGTVVDADTRAPLAGAVVVAYWSRDRIYLFHSVNEHYAVREVLTGTDGGFVIDAKRIEEGAPRRTRHPEFLIFVPGYGSFPLWQKAPTGFIGGVFEGDGTVVELQRLKSVEERRNQLIWVTPNSFTDKPFKDLPTLMKRINEERGSIGLAPQLPSEDP